MPRKFKKYNYETDTVFVKFYNRLCEIAMSRFAWNNLPDTVNERFLERTIFYNGYALYFNDEVMGNLCLPCAIGGELTVYQIPKYRRAYATNGYQMECNETNSVIIYDNYLHTIEAPVLHKFAETLCDLEHSYVVNCKAQKTPCLILCDEKQMSSLMNVYEQYDGNSPVIFGNKDTMGELPIKSINTNANFNADRIYDMLVKVWNEALTYLGVPNISQAKKERMITDEVERQNGGTLASRNSCLEMRRQCADEINKMFGTNITVDFRDGVLNQNEAISEEDNGVEKFNQLNNSKANKAIANM